ncbi:MAG: aminotransferase class I/II-fold pyridoxal phosphate-dependent enzyme [Clostridia bacterium]|nr:aminotransferase class I/II-fold pyridoxal phosphate-dependent enzyme [Clostridia bacterium]
MQRIQDLPAEELKKLYDAELARYDGFVSAGLSINMARGTPCPEQLDLSEELLDIDMSPLHQCEDGDVRNYGILSGIPECRRLFAELCGVGPDNVIIGGCSSLQLMYDYVSQCVTKGPGVPGCAPWGEQNGVKFIAVVPGYDRHFGICEYLGIELVNVPITPEGPDMDAVEELIKDPSVKGMLCVPKYSNPDGVTYSAETVERLAKMTPAAPDFRVIWDNAYCVHDLYGDGDELPNILDVAAKYGHEDNFVVFVSTSKISFPGAGVSAVAGSDANIRSILGRMKYQIISYDKINQLRHVIFFRNLDGITAHMKRHAEILRPKFETVLGTLDRELTWTGAAHWIKPRGGYFISLYVDVGSASRVGELCKKAGLTITRVGATYPYGKDPDDANIRIAPSYPDCDTLKTAAELMCCCVRIAACEELLARV